MKKILGTGMSGMVGSCITDTLHNRYEFHDISYDTGIDIRNHDLLHKYIKASEADIVLHLAAKTDVDRCEDDRKQDLLLLSKIGLSESSVFDTDKKQELQWENWKDVDTAFSINVIGTLNIAKVCHDLGKKLVYVSTDFVFNGEKETQYTEEDIPNPINHYGQTKYWGEQIVQSVMEDYLVVRPAFPYGTHHEFRKDFVRKVCERFESKDPILGIVDQVFTPTFSPDIADALDNLISHSVTNTIFHLVGSEALSPYASIVAIGQQFGYDTQLVKKITADEYYLNKAVRPRTLALKNEKIQKRGVRFYTFKKGLTKL